MLSYPAIFEPAEEGGFVVTFPDVPEGITQGDTFEEAMEMAIDALEMSLEFYIEKSVMLPTPSEAKEGQHMVTVSEGFEEQVRAYYRQRGFAVGHLSSHVTF